MNTMPEGEFAFFAVEKIVWISELRCQNQREHHFW